MKDKLSTRLRAVLDKKIYSMPKEQREREMAASDAFMKKQFIQMAFNDIFDFLKQNAAGIAFAIESKLVGRSKSFERISDESFKINIGSVDALVELKEDRISATITKGAESPPKLTLDFFAKLQDGSIFLTRAESPMSIYPDDALGDILEAVIELVD